jgi:hypothetical protein
MELGGAGWVQHQVSSRLDSFSHPRGPQAVSLEILPSHSSSGIHPHKKMDCDFQIADKKDIEGQRLERMVVDDY